MNEDMRTALEERRERRKRGKRERVARAHEGRRTFSRDGPVHLLYLWRFVVSEDF
jgi:hypothetical protein